MTWLDLSQLSESDRGRLGRKFRENAYAPTPVLSDEKVRRQQEAIWLLRVQRIMEGLALLFTGWLAWVLLS